ncbi:MAG TPA: hypothetical protein VGP68_23865 [Gemmataceae bacterium]|nr:hypothetical protein [Gemmataceae bacterium]
MPPCFAAFALLLTGAIAQQTPQTSPPSQPAKAPQPPAAAEAKPPAPDEKAAKTLKVAAELLDAKKLGWFETTLWQRVEMLGLSYESEGKYSGGPDLRMRLDLEVKLGKTTGQTTIVSDGTTVWNSTKIGATTPSISFWNLKRINEVLSAPGTSPQVRQQFYREQFFAGLAPLIQSLEQHMVYTKQEIETWKGHEVYKLSGMAAEATGKPASSWPQFVPRRCQVYLDKVTLWPHRLEWLGPVSSSGEDVILTQMEFREPKFFKGDSIPQQLSSAFKFDPGKVKALDRTQEMTEVLTRQRMSAPQQPAAVPK